MAWDGHFGKYMGSGEGSQSRGARQVSAGTTEGAGDIVPKDGWRETFLLSHSCSPHWTQMPTLVLCIIRAIPSKFPRH